MIRLFMFTFIFIFLSVHLLISICLLINYLFVDLFICLFFNLSIFNFSIFLFLFLFIYFLINSLLGWPQIHHIYILIALVSIHFLSAPLFHELYCYFIINLKRERERERGNYTFLPRGNIVEWLNSSRKSVTSCTTVEEVVVVCCQN